MKNTLDLNQCDSEPIRFINSIQSFGAIVIVDEENVVQSHSKNFFTYTGFKESNLLGEKFSFAYEKDFHIEETTVGSLKVIQFEKKVEESTLILNPYLERLQSSSNLKALLQETSQVISEIVGFDRVMIYKFHEDFHGEVVAEIVKNNAQSFYGLHYPASDIPKPARDILLENWIRTIPDVYYTPIALESLTAKSIDLGQVLIRAVSPIHIQYLKNMDVGATLTISIIVEEKLWGLIACHHPKAKLISKSLRDKCESIGRFTSSLIQVVSLKEKHFYAEKIKSIHHDLGKRLEKSDDMGKDLISHTPNLLDLIDAHGASAALYVDGYWVNIGVTPSEAQLNNLVDWLSNEHKGKAVFQTNELSSLYSEASQYTHIASGLLAVSVPKTVRNYIFWFRPELIQTVAWAGNPDKSVSEVDGKLSPRASFQEWKSTIYGKSLPWNSWEIDAALELRNLILASDLKKQFEKEQKARNEAVRAKQAREDLMAVVSHDLKNPLNSIQMNTQLLKRLLTTSESKSSHLVERILRSAVTMNSLINDILSIAKLESGQFEVEKKLYLIKDAVRESVDMLMPMAMEKNITLTEAGEQDCQVHYDFERLLQVLSNLIGNAIKFTPDNGSIEVNIEKCGPHFVKIKITDTGPGIPEVDLQNVFDRFWQAHQAKRLGTGLGLSIAKTIVEAHGGEIWVESENNQGSAFQFTLPL